MRRSDFSPLASGCDLNEIITVSIPRKRKYPGKFAGAFIAAFNRKQAPERNSTVAVQHRKSISCSLVLYISLFLIYVYVYTFFYVALRAKRHSTWRLGDIHSTLCVAAQEIDLLSIFFSFPFPFPERGEMQRCRLQSDFRCDYEPLMNR